MISRNLFILSFGVAALLGIQACSCEIQCSKAAIMFSYVGYDSLTLDTVIIRRYDKTTSGDRLKDTFLLSRTEGITYRFNLDTAFVVGSKIGGLPIFTLQSEWNYEIFIPAAGKTFKISDILEEQTSREVPCYSPTMQKSVCINSIYGITVDNRPASADGDRIWLSK